MSRAGAGVLRSAGMMPGDAEVAHFKAFGFVVLRGALEPAALAEEVDRALREGSRRSFAQGVGGGGRYVPMMCERTPVSLDALERFAAPAARLLGGPVLPVRAKCVLYYGAAHWHRDSERALGSVGFASYLEPLDADNGALRVVPGSHHGECGAALQEYFARQQPGTADEGWEGWVAGVPAVPLCSEPGDVIAFDEHLFHASARGRDRRQWRVDYVRDAGDDAELRAYFAGLFPREWDGGYDVERYPSYRRWPAAVPGWRARLEQLGVLAAAAAQEDFVRSRM